MKRRFLAVLVAVLLVPSGSALAGYREVSTDGPSPGVYYDSWMECISYRQLGPTDDYPDMWEYVYDVFVGTETWLREVTLFGFDGTQINNLHYSSTNRWSGDFVMQTWDHHVYMGDPTWGNFQDRDRHPSYWDNNEWTLPVDPQPNAAWAMVNPWHNGTDYNSGGRWYYPGRPEEDGLHFDGDNSSYRIPDVHGGTSNTLIMTFRVVHPNAPNYGGNLYEIHRNDVMDPNPDPDFDSCWGHVIGPSAPLPPPPPGSFDGDQDVDNIDIDMLCDFIRNTMPYDVLYDISGDGVTGGTDGFVDTLDLDYLVRFLVYTDVDEGTEYGDFNLDGVIDTTDLTRLATNYGSDDWKWDDGNANRYIDTDIDNTDLTILATYFGFGEPDVIPEPASAGLLLLGALAVLRRRRKAKR